ncbi:MAG: hypothetical protein K6E37_05895 [Bacteroidales bacterium]|nr:hypothetical protein [Bacteroidales bacterium]
MEIEYSNKVTGSDFRTTTENFVIEGKFRKDAASGNIIELNASARRKGDMAVGADEIGFWGNELRYTVYGKTAAEVAEIAGAIEESVEEIEGGEAE